MYLWLCSPDKWLPECEKSRDLYKSASIKLQRTMSFTLSRFANVPTASEFPYVFCSYSSERTTTKRCCKKWTVGQCLSQAKFENCSFKSNCSITKMAPKSETSRKHQESHFVCPSWIIYWLQCSKDANNLREIHTSEKRTRPNRFASIRT